MKSLPGVLTKFFLVQAIHERVRTKSDRSGDVTKKITKPIEPFDGLNGYFILTG